jgi:hypothetical protein
MRSVRAVVTRFPQIALWSAISRDIAFLNLFSRYIFPKAFNGSMQ